MSTNSSSYQDLNLREGASINEIKAAFRNLAKAYHHDAAGQSQADVEKFIKAQSAYQKLMKKAVAHNQARRQAAAQAAPRQARQTDTAVNWRLEGSREVGLDIYYRLSILRPGGSSGCRVVLPWQVQEACPRCLGQGQTLAKLGSNSLYRPCACGKCGGKGTLARDSQVEVNISADQVGQTKIRLRKAGLYQAKSAQRGDLILDITWVDELPRHN